MLNRKRKFLFSTITLILFLFISCSCGDSNLNYKKYSPKYGPKFSCVESYNDPYIGSVKILVDKETRIMYIYFNNVDGNDPGSTGMSVIYDGEGKPKKYQGAIKD